MLETAKGFRETKIQDLSEIEIFSPSEGLILFVNGLKHEMDSRRLIIM